MYFSKTNVTLDLTLCHMVTIYVISIIENSSQRLEWNLSRNVHELQMIALPLSLVPWKRIETNPGRVWTLPYPLSNMVFLKFFWDISNCIIPLGWISSCYVSTNENFDLDIIFSYDFWYNIVIFFVLFFILSSIFMDTTFLVMYA